MARTIPINVNATGASQPLPSTRPGTPGRETHEREAAFARSSAMHGHLRLELCSPRIPGLEPELLFTLLAEHVRDYAIFLMDADGIIRCWGEGARLMKWWTREQTVGGHLRMLYPDGGSEDGTAEDHLICAAERGEYSGEGHRARSDGSQFWAYVTLTALRNAAGDLVGFAKVTRDFSARRAVEAALKRERHVTPETQQVLEEATRLKQLFVALSHELRTPLNAIIGSIPLLERQIATGDSDPSHIARVQRNSQHVLAIINDVLDISRIDAGQLPLTPGIHRLGPAIEEALADVETELEKRKLTFANAVSGTAADLPYWGDENRVRQIVVNLLTNAIKFTEPGGSITISGGTGEAVTGAALQGPGPWAYVRVEDTGRGIAPESLGAIFEPYRQYRTSDQHKGTGLGLAISRQLARLMGGDLTAESQVGVGSRFTLWLPIAPADPIPR